MEGISPIYSMLATTLIVVLAMWGVGCSVALFFPRVRKPMRVVGYISLTVLIPLLFLVIFELLYYPPFTKKRVIFGQGEGRKGTYMVVGETDGPPDWQVTFYWKPRSAPWAAYYLDCDGDYWTDFKMTESGDQLLLVFPREYEGTTATLDLKTGRFTRQPANLSGDEPLYLYPGKDPFAPSVSCIDTYSKDWPAAWANFQQALAAAK